MYLTINYIHRTSILQWSLVCHTDHWYWKSMAL